MASVTVANVAVAFVDLGLAYWVYREIRSLTNFKRLKQQVGVNLPLDPRTPALDLSDPFNWVLNSLSLTIGPDFQSLPLLPVTPARDLRTYVPPLRLSFIDFGRVSQQCQQLFSPEPKRWHQGEWTYWPSCVPYVPMGLYGWTAKNDISNYEQFFLGSTGGGLVQVSE